MKRLETTERVIIAVHYILQRWKLKCIFFNQRHGRFKPRVDGGTLVDEYLHKRNTLYKVIIDAFV